MELYLLEYEKYFKFIEGLNNNKFLDDDYCDWSIFVILVRYKIMTTFEKYDSSENELNLALGIEELSKDLALRFENFEREFIDFSLAFCPNKQVSFDEDMNDLLEKYKEENEYIYH